MRLPRFRIRTLMIAVAVVGLDSAYVTWLLKQLPEANWESPAVFVLYCFVWYAFTLWVVLRLLGASR